MNTSRNHWRTVIRIFALGIVTGSFLTAGIILLAGPAKADPDVARGERVVCLLLDQDPSLAGIIKTATVIEQKTGVSDYTAGQMIAASVYDQCPEYIPLLKSFVDTYGGGSHASGKQIGGKVA